MSKCQVAHRASIPLSEKNKKKMFELPQWCFYNEEASVYIDNHPLQFKIMRTDTNRSAYYLYCKKYIYYDSGFSFVP